MADVRFRLSSGSANAARRTGRSLRVPHAPGFRKGGWALKLGRQALGTFAAVLIRNGLALIAGVILARYLGPEGRGEWAALLFLPALLQMAFGLGIPVSHVILGSRERFRLEVLWGNALVHSLLVGIVALGMAAVLSHSAPDVLRDLGVRRELLPWMMTAAALLLLQDHARSLLQAKRRILVNNSLDLCWQVALLAGTAITLTSGYGLPGVVGAYLGALLLYHLIAGPALLRIAHRPSLRGASAALRASAPLGLVAWAADLTQWLHYRVDIFLLMALRPISEVGFYALAVSLAESLWLMSRSLFPVLLPALAECDETTRRHRVLRASRLGTGFGALAGAVLALSCRPLVALVYTRAFLPAVLPIILLIPGAVLLGCARPFSARYLSEESPWINARISASGLLLNLLLNALLIPRWGPSGAAIATSCSYACMFLVYLYLFRRETSCSWRDLLIPTREDLLYLKRVVA